MKVILIRCFVIFFAGACFQKIYWYLHIQKCQYFASVYVQVHLDLYSEVTQACRYSQGAARKIATQGS